MSEDSSKNGLIKLGSASLTRYSSFIVRRAIENLSSRSAAVIRPPTRKYTVLLITRDEGFVQSLRVALDNPNLRETRRVLKQDEQIDLRVIGATSGYEEVLSELSKGQTDMVVISDKGITNKEILLLAGHITINHPNMITFVTSNYAEEEFVWALYSVGVDAFLRLPYDITELAEVIDARLCWGMAIEGRINLLLPYYFNNHSSIFDDMGFLTIRSDNSKELIEKLEMWEVDIAIEWRESESDCPVRDMLRKSGKNAPVFLCQNLGGQVLANAFNAGYADTLHVPFQATEIKEKFFKVLPRIKQAIFERTIRAS